MYLVGESMGGLLSLCVASERPDLITRLILVNPASSFDKSAWSVLGPALPSIPNEFWGALPYALTPVLFDPLRMASGLMETIASAEPQEALEADDVDRRQTRRVHSSRGRLGGDHSARHSRAQIG